MVYAYSLLCHRHDPLMEAVAASEAPRLGSYSLQEFSLLLKAYGSFGATRPAAQGLIDASVGALSRHYAAMTPQGLMACLKALCKLGVAPQPLLADVAAHILSGALENYSPMEVSHLLWAYANLQICVPELFDAALRHMQSSVAAAARAQQHRSMKHHVDSVVKSCLAVGHDVSGFVEFAEMRGFIVKYPMCHLPLAGVRPAAAGSGEDDQPGAFAAVAGGPLPPAPVGLLEIAPTEDGGVGGGTTLTIHRPDEAAAASRGRGRDGRGQRAAPAHLYSTGAARRH